MDSGIAACVSRSKENFVVLDGILYYMDMARKDGIQ